ncbi:Ig-like domain-containing domain [Aureispira sp. CCB-QB1]|uniref:Ig-like domain-containing domain n=1 Tax=Aureispira sp. CCB-QB1 TaxID=1313421 RepID=UPI000698E453|nr:Ig-like domain-containing domain [Aureispira sp. CCB-QB1]
MQNKIYSTLIGYWWSICFLGLVFSCAEPRAPEGGPQDKQPPRIHTKKYSTPNPSTNFRDNQVILTFDEWVKLEAAYTQVVISPPLEKRPDIKVRNKSVVVEWKEPLKDSTTYIIHFGDAIKDITEGNSASNLKMVFSTGPQLDSLSCSGQIVDAETRAPKADVWVMLYQNLADSVPKTEKPYYFTKTDARGNFKLEYLKKGRYRIFALDDKNRDYKYNQNNESIAFLDSSFQINDTIQPVFRLRMFQERAETRVLSSKLEAYGALKVTLNNKVQSPNRIQLLDAPSDFKTWIEQGQDTFRLWFDGTMPDTGKWVFVLQNEAENLKDTLEVKAKERRAYLETATNLRWYKKRARPASSEGKSSKGPVVVLLPLQDTLAIEQHPFENLKLHFTRPIVAVDTNQILLLRDTSLSVVKMKITEIIDSLSEEISLDTIYEEVLQDTFLPVSRPSIAIQQHLELEYQWQIGARYKLMILPEGVTDYLGLMNQDTLSRIYTINPEDKYGSVTAVIKNADSTLQYVVQLLDSKGNLVQEAIVKDSTQMTFIYKNIPTDTYTIRVIHDALPNGRWDVGSYEENRQAELTTSTKPINLNPGWENMMELDLTPVELSRDSQSKRKKGFSEEVEDDTIDEKIKENKKEK